MSVVSFPILSGIVPFNPGLALRDLIRGENGRIRIFDSMSFSSFISHPYSTISTVGRGSYSSMSLLRFPMLSGIGPINPGFWARRLGRDKSSILLISESTSISSFIPPTNSIISRDEESSNKCVSDLRFPMLSGI